MMATLTPSCVRSPVRLELISSVESATLKYAIVAWSFYSILNFVGQWTTKNISLVFYAKEAMREVIQKKDTYF